MGLESFQVENFRCLDSVSFEPHQNINLIVGSNGAGKTSLLEAIFFLGRGRSFRATQPGALIQNGESDFTVFGKVSDPDAGCRLGIRVDRGGSDVHIDGESGCSMAALIDHFPVQIVDPEVHQLIQGGPAGRRQFLDWGVFHVKHDFLEVWRRYRRILRQRNMALKQGASGPAVDAWNPELVQAGTQVDELRKAYLDGFATIFGRISEGLLGQPGNCRYLSGWADGLSYAEALEESRERDRTNGLTHVGPHRAEVALDFDRRAARHRLSRGQQKLMGTALVLAQSEFVAEKIGRPVTLLVDEPAAELDAERLKCLMQAVVSPGVQLFVTALHRDALPLDAPRAVFHVEHGEVSPLL